MAKKKKVSKKKKATTALAKKDQAELAAINDNILTGFGDINSKSPSIELAWPVMKMGKDEYFEVADEKVKSIDNCQIIFQRPCRAYFAEEFGTGSDMPDCASSDGLRPDSGDNQQSDSCATCDRARWYKDEDDKNVCDCSKSALLFILRFGQDIPELLRVRGTSCSKKSSLAKFLVNCKTNGYAPANAYQLVKVNLSLEKTVLNKFPTSLLVVEQAGVIHLDELNGARAAMRSLAMAKELQAMFQGGEVSEAVHQRESDEAEPADDTPF